MVFAHDSDFFVLFQKQADDIVSGAQAFTKLLKHYTGVPEQVQIIKAIEHMAPTTRKMEWLSSPPRWWPAV